MTCLLLVFFLGGKMEKMLNLAKKYRVVFGAESKGFWVPMSLFASHSLLNKGSMHSVHRAFVV